MNFSAIMVTTRSNTRAAIGSSLLSNEELQNLKQAESETPHNQDMRSKRINDRPQKKKRKSDSDIVRDQEHRPTSNIEEHRSTEFEVKKFVICNNLVLLSVTCSK